MAKTLDPTLAANILDKWINLYGMENQKAWPREDYGYVKRAAEAMRLAIEILRDGTVTDRKEVKKLYRFYGNGQLSTIWMTRNRGKRWTFPL